MTTAPTFACFQFRQTSHVKPEAAQRATQFCISFSSLSMCIRINSAKQKQQQSQKENVFLFNASPYEYYYLFIHMICIFVVSSLRFRCDFALCIVSLSFRSTHENRAQRIHIDGISRSRAWSNLLKIIISQTADTQANLHICIIMMCSFVFARTLSLSLSCSPLIGSYERRWQFIADRVYINRKHNSTTIYGSY